MFVILIYTSYSKCRVVPLPVVADVQLTEFMKGRAGSGARLLKKIGSLTSKNGLILRLQARQVSTPETVEDPVKSRYIL